MLVAQSCLTLQLHGLQPTKLLSPWDFPGKDTGMGHHFLLQGIFPTQGSNVGLLHCRQILYQLSYKGNPANRISQSVQLVQSLNCVRLFATPWIAARQASLSITNSQSLLRLMPIKLVSSFFAPRQSLIT